jgi:hypothetical protein
MGCLLLILGFLGPRVGIVFLWAFTDRLTNAYDNGIVPVVGFFVAPWTTFLYGIVQGQGDSVGALGTFMIFIGILLDLASTFGAYREQRRRMAPAAS